VYRMGKGSISGVPQAFIAAAAVALAAFDVLGTAAVLLLAGGVGLFLFHSRRLGAIAVAMLAALFSAFHFAFPETAGTAVANETAPRLPGSLELAAFFFKVGALTFGGGLSIIAFVHQQVVSQFHWLTPQEFIDGLALGQFTPGPTVMVAAYVGYKTGGLGGACVAAAAIFLPSFILVLSIFPVFDRMRDQVWIKAAMKGIMPAVIGVIAVALLHLAPHALPNAFALVMFAAALAALIAWRPGIVKLMLAGAIVGMLASWFLPFATIH
jgi:chromate transporter